jgi:hypothetical protein
MIPSTDAFLDEDFEIEEEPSKTYKMDLEGNHTSGYCDELEAVKQAVFKALNTERYAFIMYSWDYGIETADLYGQPVTWVCPELERRITEALSLDTRITEVTDFEHDISVKGVVHTSFTVNTIYGDFTGERTVNI